MNPAMILVASLVLCALPSVLGANPMCYHCAGSISSQKLCNSMAEYTNQTCMSADAHCATTEIKSHNFTGVTAYVLGCVEEPHNCSSYKEQLCQNVTMEVGALNFTIEVCNTRCCNDTSLCNGDFVPTMAPETTPTTSETGTATEGTTSAACVFRPEFIGMLSIVLMAVFFGLQ